MSNVYTSDGHVGLGVPWSIIAASSYSASLSTISSRSPIPGVPVPDQDTDALCVAEGDWETPPSAGTGYTFRVQQGGHVGPAGATFGWRDSSESATSLRGHSWPTYARRMWAGLARTNETAGESDQVLLPSGRTVIVQGVRNASAYNEIRAGWAEDDAITGATAGTEINILSDDAADAAYQGWSIVAAQGYPAVAYWEEEGRVLCAVRYLFASASLGQVAIFESADEGATWSLRTARALIAPFLTSSHNTYGRLTFRRCGGSWLLIDTYSDGTDWTQAHYAGTSPDAFTLLETAILTDGSTYTEIRELTAAGDGDGLVLLGAAYDTGGAAYVDVLAIRLGSAWQPISEGERTSITTAWAAAGTPIAGRYPGAALDPDGTLWGAFLSPDRAWIYLTYSLDRGENWNAAGYHPLETDTAASMQYLSVGLYRGGLLMVFAGDTGASWADHNTARGWILACGHWDNDPLPYLPANITNGSFQGRAGFGQRYSTTWTWGVADTNRLSWFPPVNITTPSVPAALTGAAPTYGVPDGQDPYLDFADAGAGSYADWAPTAITYDTNGIIVEVDCVLQAAGTSILADNRIMQVRLPNAAGTARMEVSVRVSATQVQLYDELAGAVITTLTLAGTTRRTYRLCMSYISSIKLAFRYKEPSAQVWSEYTGTTTTGGAAAAERIRFGAVTTNGQTMRIYKAEFLGTIGPKGLHDPSRAISASFILGRPCSPRALHIYGGLRLAWRSGPLHPGHTWTLGASAEYPPELVGPRDYPSQSDRWQSASDGVTQEWVWLADSGRLWRPPGVLFFLAVLYADGIQTLTLAGRDSAGAYQTLITGNLSAGSATLSYTAPTTGAATGGTLRPNTTGNVAGRPWRENELAGGWLLVAATSHAYRITGNSPGLWGPSSNLKPTIYVADWDSTEASTGTITVYPPGSFHASGEQNPGIGYDRFRLQITSNANTVDGRYALKVAIGSIFVAGKRYSFGRTPSVEPVARGVETAGGRSFYDPNQPLRRFARFSWADPYGTADYHTYTAAGGPDTLLLAQGGTYPASFVNSTHRELEGVLRLLGGPGRCLLYLPRVLAQLTSWSTTDPDRWLYGRIISALTTPRPYGDESVREEVLVSELTIREEP